MNNLHMIAGISAGGCLQFALKDYPEEKLIVLKDYLSIGPLSNISSEEGIIQRYQYFKKIFEMTNQSNDIKYIKEEIGIKDLLKLKDFKYQIYYYYSKSANEQIYLRAICHYLKNCKINIIDVNKVLEDDSIISTSQLNPEDFILLKKEALLIDETIKRDLSNQFINIMNDNASLRLFENGEIIASSSAFIDSLIIKYTSKDFHKAAIIAGKTLGSLGFELSDTYVDYRIRVLINKGILEAENKDKELRNLLIKKNFIS